MTKGECRTQNEGLSRRTGNWSWWPVLLHTHMFGVTTTPDDLSDFLLCLPGDTVFKTVSTVNTLSYNVMLHSDRNIFSYDPNVHALIRIDNNICHRHIKVTIDRYEKLNTKSQPCNPDPNYSLGACQRKCYMDWLDCSMEENENSTKKLCMEWDYHMLKESLFSFYTSGRFAYVNREPAGCDCPEPCVQDRISYSSLSSVTECDDNLQREITIFYVQFSVNRVRRTMMTVLTFDLEDLMAYMGPILPTCHHVRTSPFRRCDVPMSP